MKNSCVIGFAAASAALLAFSGRAAEPLVSEVKPYGGVPTLWIDGRPSTGCMFWSGAFGSDRDIEVMRNAGVHLYNACLGVDADDPATGGDVLAKRFEGFDAKIARIVRVDPQAKVLVRIGTAIPFTAWWVKAHPEERVRYYDIASGGWNCSDFASPSSPSWNPLMYAAVRRIVRHCEETWPDRILGYNPGACSCTEDMYACGNKIADFSDCQTRASGRPAPDPRRLLARHPFDFRRLLDPKADEDLVAFRRFQSVAMGQTVCRLARTVKDELARMNRRKICGAFYGYVCRHENNAALFCDGHQAEEMVYASPDVDFICAPIDYTARQLGGAAFAQCMPGAVAAHGKLYYAEEDSRLHLANHPHDAAYRTTVREEESRWTLLRNFFDTYSHGGAIWWMDLNSKGWYRDDWFSTPLAECRAFAERHLARRETAAEIAVFVHTDAIAYERAAPTLLSADLVSGMLPEICSIGAPYDIYHLTDLPRLAQANGLRPYRMAVILNAHTASAAVRRTVREHLCRGAFSARRTCCRPTCCGGSPKRRASTSTRPTAIRSSRVPAGSRSRPRCRAATASRRVRANPSNWR